MKEIEIDSMKQFERRLVIEYSYTEGYEKRNHLGQVISTTGKAGKGQLIVDLDHEYAATVMKDLLERKVKTITEGYF